VSPEIGGRVADLPVHAGDMVRAGDVLVRIEDSQYRSQVTNAARALDAAREGEKEACLSTSQAERDLARAERLAKEQIISDEMIDQARSRRDMARASCEAARARSRQVDSQLQVTRDELAKTVVRAPFGGVVAELKAERGEWIMPSPPGIPMPAILDLIDTDSIYVSAPLDEVDRAKVSVDRLVRITMDAYPGRSFPGRITRVAPYIEDLTEQSRTFEVEATFDDAAFARTLPPGASADVEVILGARDDVMRIPTYALLEGKRVLVLERECPGAAGGRLLGELLHGGGECLVSKAVTTGLRNWEFVEVREGLKEGERVVVSLDRAEVKEGARVRQTAVAEK
jgi:HlyD family secretion protein